MTTLRYPQGCASGSEVPELAFPSDYAWNVNLHNGNVNRNNQTNHNNVRAVRAGECHDAVSFRSLHSAWARARRGKKPSPDQLSFDAYWIDNLLDLQRRLNSKSWAPGKPTCFIATSPKAREIHAPPFGDRVVHHWLVPQLEAIYERSFIHDSFSNRTGKGTHAAVDRCRSFIRQVQSGQGGGWYLQLDIKNFFNSIHRPTLYAMLKERMERHGLPLVVRRATHALLRQSPVAGGVHFVGTEAERAQVPAHKRLENAAPGCGIAIGNLSSQFFANVYLDALDQFVKHELKAPRYLRYVDDFVLVHQSRDQLQAWQAQIETFLRERLRLELKADIKLKPLSAGCDFLGYVIYPTHSVVRRRVIGHARAKLSAWQRQHISAGRIRAKASHIEGLRSVWASYAGHFRHANSRRLFARFHSEYPWIQEICA
jgi:RNA-directed DNA polymerase